MDLHKTKFYLDKLNREYARMSKDPDTIVRIDVDIMASYVRELYDAILTDSAAPVFKTETTPSRKPAVSKPAVVEEPPAPAQAQPVAPPPPPVYEPAPPPPPPPPPPVYEQAAPPPPPPVVEEKPAPAAPPVVVEPKPQPVVASQSTDPFPSGVETLFEERQAKELSDKLSELPIPDLKKAIALNDRLLLTRELFAGDGQAFETTIAVLNGFTNFSEAKNYLVDNCVIRYGWLDKKRVEEAKQFIRLIRRRYK
ncbi:MAG TPA: hypothetical protein PLM41_14170 [Saprospiraceae bacterium]|nr:hypothetical protein [Saprospiraceae bacterium]